MIVVGLTGGIGCGKSTVASALSHRGAVIVDTDAIARAVVQPGEAAHEAVARRFGEDLLDPDGNIDRKALADIVFSDPLARSDLEGIVHPTVRQIVKARLAEEAPTDHVVVLEVPLLVRDDGTRAYDVDGLLVVDAPVELALRRLIDDRQMDESDATARIAAQVPRQTRLRAADYIIFNIGTTAELDDMVGQAWRWMSSLSSATQ